MIPLLLELEAFGPFKQPQLIDFTKLDSNRLFLISGKTGSGKTTIFDAITFALFGEASGSIRRVEDFKSQFADDDTTCFVRYKFLVNNQTYTVYREPPQNKLKRGGNVSISKPIAELTLDDGTIIAGIKVVDEKIHKILGINCDQFKKIAMLPQGEFRRFLSEKTSSKQETLRQIFKTFQLDLFIKKLYEKTSSLNQSLKNISLINTNNILSIKFADNTDLYNACEKGVSNIAEITSLLNLYNQQLTEKSTSINKVIITTEDDINDLNLLYHIEVNKSFELLEKEQQILNELNKKSDQFKQIEIKIERLKIIESLLPTRKSITDTKRYILELDNKLQNCIELNKVLTDNFSIAQQNLEEQTVLKNSTNEIAISIEQLKQQANIIENIDTLKSEITSCNSLISSHEKMLISLEQYGQYLVTVEKISLLDADITLINKAIKSIADFKHLKIDYNDKAQQYKTTFNQFLASQATILSGTLIDNVPCPVCGSCDHPNKAIFTSIVTQSELDIVKNDYDKITQILEQKNAERLTLIDRLGFIDAPTIIDDLQNKLNLVSDEKTSLNDSISALSNKLDMSAKQVTTELSEITQKLTIFKQKILEKNSSIDSLTSKLTSYDDDKHTISQKIYSLQQKIDTINKLFNQTQLDFNRINNNFERNNESIKQLTEFLLNEKAKLTNLKNDFSNVLADNNMSVDEYKSLFVDLNVLNGFQTQLNKYNSSIIATTSLINSLQSRVEGKVVVDINQLQQQFDTLNATLQLKKQELKTIMPILLVNGTIHEKLVDSNKQYQSITTEYDNINQLYVVANGSLSNNINFESYVLSYYFNKVITNANIRLAQMTNKRYTILIRQEKEKYGASSGLELNILDSHTGRQRDVITLSGGESFKLALALSLGLSDITTEYSGGIEINTLFIDEGFGSLDSDSIESAIECLSSLNLDGRVIGIISHVSELKERITSKIIVSQQQFGSSIHF